MNQTKLLQKENKAKNTEKKYEMNNTKCVKYNEQRRYNKKEVKSQLKRILTTSLLSEEQKNYNNNGSPSNTSLLNQSNSLPHSDCNISFSSFSEGNSIEHVSNYDSGNEENGSTIKSVFLFKLNCDKIKKKDLDSTPTFISDKARYWRSNTDCQYNDLQECYCLKENPFKVKLEDQSNNQDKILVFNKERQQKAESCIKNNRTKRKCTFDLSDCYLFNSKILQKELLSNTTKESKNEAKGNDASRNLINFDLVDLGINCEFDEEMEPSKLLEYRINNRNPRKNPRFSFSFQSKKDPSVLSY